MVPVHRLPDQHLRLLARALEQLGHQRRLSHRKQLSTSRPLLAVHAGHNDLAHDRCRRRHPRQDSLGQDTAQSRQPLLHRLSCRADLGIPAELDVDHRQAGRRLAADRLHSAGTQQRDLKRLCHQGLDLLGRQSWTLGDDDHTRSIEVGEDVDRHLRRQVRSVHHQRQADHDDQSAITKCESDDCVEHVSLSGPQCAS